METLIRAPKNVLQLYAQVFRAFTSDSRCLQGRKRCFRLKIKEKEHFAAGRIPPAETGRQRRSAVPWMRQGVGFPLVPTELKSEHSSARNLDLKIRCSRMCHLGQIAFPKLSRYCNQTVFMVLEADLAPNRGYLCNGCSDLQAVFTIGKYSMRGTF